ncbi:hypothetical protein CFN78_22880 [Amycolatopsis antarctica]|uniref:Uncharacterized protein n=1 Tax=Amycolatopsis antarctica TaxID=1854586 RepID=A0A263CXW8_9PSEU|nr:hypothetical protein [Amycolatopsis antarctica]OZM70992.1 hypothetical protein CFN78_22880 [Amycolatopsis antarctica]
MDGHVVRERETDRISRSGWTTLAPLRETVRDPREILDRQSGSWWNEVASVVDEMSGRFREYRFADDAEIGILYVPAANEFDTHEPRDAGFRTLQHESLTDDFVDDRLTRPTLSPGREGGARFYVTTVGRYGVPMGSYEDIVSMPADALTVAGQDTRAGMTRQLWSARLAQAGSESLPDWEGNPRWTFTLFVGDGLCDDQAASGTVLKSRVRFRLGKPDRGIASARVAPAVEIQYT